MRNNWYKNGLVVGIIVLFIGVSVLSSVSSKDISVSDEEMLEGEVELEDNNEIEPLDNYREIISNLYACIDEGGVITPKFSFYPLDFGELHITRSNSIGSFEIFGIRFPTPESPKFRFKVDAEEVYAKWAFGSVDWYYLHPSHFQVAATAFGNIEWSE